MTKIALTATALLLAAGSAFAGSENFQSNGANQPAPIVSGASIDGSYTASIRHNSGSQVQTPAVTGEQRLGGNS